MKVDFKKILFLQFYNNDSNLKTWIVTLIPTIIIRKDFSYSLEILIIWLFFTIEITIDFSK